MRQFFAFIKKETRHILRDKRTTIILLIIPVVLLLILGFGISTEIKNTPFVVFDQSHSTLSHQLTDEISANKFFKNVGNIHSPLEIERIFRKNKAKIAIVIPHSFADDWRKLGKTDLQVIIDASDPSEATNLANYLQMMISQFQQNIANSNRPNLLINMEIKMQYNPQMKSAYAFVPGLMGVILLLICAMMTSIAIVKEKEMGTMEVLLVSPLKPLTIVLAKAVPYFAISMTNVASILLIAHFILDVPINGNLLLTLLLCVIFTLSALSLGLLISSITETQQSAVLASILSLMLPSILLTGMIFPLESMPKFLQFIANFIPAKWFIQALRAVMIKGLGITAIWKELTILSLMTVFLLGLSVRMFKQRL
ncbi:MAG: ABC transporter permease [Flavobacteriaceae bacterium]|jgi:ABC-2 type transport system permease protein|nr:ABC transporter permease [Flavobacteriaceae bacterium]